MHNFLPFTEETPKPTPLKVSFSFDALDSLSLSAWISRKTFGISILGGLFRFKEEESAECEDERGNLKPTMPSLLSGKSKEWVAIATLAKEEGSRKREIR